MDVLIEKHFGEKEMCSVLSAREQTVFLGAGAQGKGFAGWGKQTDWCHGSSQAMMFSRPPVQAELFHQ